MEDVKLVVREIEVKKLKEYEPNAKIHTSLQIKKIMKSIEAFGFNDPIGIDEDYTIIEGHGRLMAAKRLGMKKVPCIMLSHMTDSEKKAYCLAHNKLTMDTGFDIEKLQSELRDIDSDEIGKGFVDDILDFDSELESAEEIDPKNIKDDDYYTNKIIAPQYLIKGDCPELSELVNCNKTKKLIKAIDKSNVTAEEKVFLKRAAYRHNVFTYDKIAEYYAHADKEMQKLMEDSALVIIDYNDAIKNGYVALSKDLLELCVEELEDD